jgi:hypothetical protein
MSKEVRDYLDYLESSSLLSQPLFSSQMRIPQDKIRQIFEYSGKLNLKPVSKYHSLHIYNQFYYLSESSLLMHASLLISSKLYESDSINFENIQSLTNMQKSSICNLENEILIHSSNEFSENTLFEWVSLFISLGFSVFSTEKKLELAESCCKFIDIVYLEGNLLQNCPVGLISASILLCSLQFIPFEFRDKQVFEAFSIFLHTKYELIEYLSSIIYNLSLDN